MRFDVAIAGAGVVGLSTARALAQRGAKVVVFDPSLAGGLGSRAAAGVAVPSAKLLDDPDMVQFTVAGRTTLHEDVVAIGIGGTRRGEGILRPMPDEKSRDAMLAKGPLAQEWFGRWASAEEVYALEPALAGSPMAGAFVNDEARMIDTDSYIGALLATVSSSGVQVRLGQSVKQVSESGSGVELTCESERLTADRLVIAAGAWSGGVPGLAPLPIKPLRGQMLTVFHPTVRLSRIVSGPSYLAPWRHGEIVVGATEEDAGFAPNVTPAGLMHLSATVARYAPLLREARFVNAWAGLRSLAPSGRPMIGVYPGCSRTFLASGHGGQGILTGGFTGRAVADLLTTGKSDAVAAFDPARALAQPARANG